MKRYLLASGIGVACFLSHQALAGTMGIIDSPGHVYLGGTVGSSWGQLGNSNPAIRYYNNLLTDAYPVTHRTSATSVLGLSGGYEWKERGRLPAMALGIGAYTTPSEYHYNGTVIETSQGGPSNRLYTNNFHISTTRVMLEGKLSWLLSVRDQTFLPYIDAGIGSAWNHASDYTETVATSNGYLPLPGFQSKTSGHFAYQVGAGAGYAFNIPFSQAVATFKHERVSLGYRFSGLGGASFGIRNASYPYALNTGTLTTQDVYLNWTHLF